MSSHEHTLVGPFYTTPLWAALVCFRVEFKVLVVTHKALHGMEFRYLQGRFSMIVSTYYPSMFDRRGMQWVLQLKNDILCILGNMVFGCSICTLKHHTTWDRLSLLTFCKLMKTWICSWARGLIGKLAHWKLLIYCLAGFILSEHCCF